MGWSKKTAMDIYTIYTVDSYPATEVSEGRPPIGRSEQLPEPILGIEYDVPLLTGRY
jgi:hypothetical protein